MSYGYPVVFRSDKVARSQTQDVEFFLKITGAKTNSGLALLTMPILVGYDAAALTQVLVETFTGQTSSAACATIFDSTSLGTDTIGFVIDMAGQVDKVYAMEVAVVQSAGGTPANTLLLIEASQAALTSSNTSAIAEYDGNLYGRVVAGNLDSATAGYVRIRVKFKSI